MPTRIDRLFVLNAERAEEEKRLGVAKPAKGAKGKKADQTSKRKAAPKKRKPDEQATFFASKDES